MCVEKVKIIRTQSKTPSKLTGRGCKEKGKEKLLHLVRPRPRLVGSPPQAHKYYARERAPVTASLTSRWRSPPPPPQNRRADSLSPPPPRDPIAMTISSSLASRLGPGGPTRWSPYARAPDPGHGAGRSSVPPGGGGNSRPPLRVAPATARLLGHPARKGAAAPPGSRCRAEAEAEATAASDAACPNPPRRGCEETNPNPNPKRNPKPAERGEEPPVRAVGCGGFAFLCALAGHTEVIIVSPHSTIFCDEFASIL